MKFKNNVSNFFNCVLIYWHFFVIGHLIYESFPFFEYFLNLRLTVRMCPTCNFLYFLQRKCHIKYEFFDPARRQTPFLVGSLKYAYTQLVPIFFIN